MELALSAVFVTRWRHSTSLGPARRGAHRKIEIQCFDLWLPQSCAAVQKKVSYPFGCIYNCFLLPTISILLRSRSLAGSWNVLYFYSYKKNFRRTKLNQQSLQLVTFKFIARHDGPELLTFRLELL
jgi:hypothetical protein